MSTARILIPNRRAIKPTCRLIDANLEIHADAVQISELSVIEVTANIKYVGRGVVGQFSRDPGVDFVSGEFLGGEIVIPFIGDERGKDLFVFKFHRERESEFVAVTSGIAPGVTDSEFEPAAILYRKILPFIPNGQIEPEPVFVLLTVSQGLAPAVNVSG